MKIIKVALIALSLMFLSCSQEEEIVIKDTETAYQNKNRGLTEAQVSELREICAQFSTSVEFLNMRSKAEEFAEMMNNNIDDRWSSRSDVENWLDSNLTETNFATKEEGLVMFDDLTSATGTFYDANMAFYRDLSLATSSQVQVILEPIEPIVEPIIVTTSCQSACANFFYGFLGDEINFYQAAVSAINNNGSLPAEVKKRNLAIAEANLQAGIGAAFTFAALCLSDCG